MKIYSQQFLPLLVVMWCFWGTTSAFGQLYNSGPKDFFSGLIMEDEVGYDQAPQLSVESGGSKRLPGAVNLERFCPEVRNQGDIFSCVGWATGYGAMTIERAIQNNWTDKAQITAQANSALFIFNQIKQEGVCDKGSRISDAMDLLLNQGDCLASNFDFDVNDCSKEADDLVLNEAESYRVGDYTRLFDRKTGISDKVNRVKLALSHRKPVVIGMSVRKNFYMLEQAKTWWPDKGDISPAGGHAMVVVGYSDKRAAFRLFNSWGTNWGDNGFIWVKYKDFGKYCKYAYAIFLDKDVRTNGQISARKPRRRDRVASNQSNARRGTRPRPDRNQKKPRKRPSNARPPQNNAAVAQQQAQKPSASNNQALAQRNAKKPPRPSKEAVAQQQRPQASNKTTEKLPSQHKKEPQIPSQRAEPETTAYTAPARPLLKMGGKVEFKQFKGWINNEPRFVAREMRLEPTGYRLKGRPLQLANRFQFSVTNSQPEQYIYVFSIDPMKKVTFHWPRQASLNPKFKGSNESAVMLDDQAEIIVPGKLKAMQTNFVGKEHLIILFSNQKIRASWLKKFAGKMARNKGTLAQALYTEIKDFIVPGADVNFFPGKMQFESSTRSDGSIVPIVLEIDVIQ